MKKVLLFSCLIVFLVASGFSTLPESAAVSANVTNVVSSEFSTMAADELLNMTPSKYKQITGKKLGLKNTLALKAAQKSVKKQFLKGGAPSIDKGIYILLAILIPFLAVGLASDWKGSEWIVALLLTALCYIPGLIYALIKMKNYY
jgi:uncharacterized membrane protein YqaE (UPF0057 family)